MVSSCRPRRRIHTIFNQAYRVLCSRSGTHHDGHMVCFSFVITMKTSANDLGFRTAGEDYPRGTAS